MRKIGFAAIRWLAYVRHLRQLSITQRYSYEGIKKDLSVHIDEAHVGANLDVERNIWNLR